MRYEDLLEKGEVLKGGKFHTFRLKPQPDTLDMELVFSGLEGLDYRFSFNQLGDVGNSLFSESSGTGETAPLRLRLGLVKGLFQLDVVVSHDCILQQISSLQPCTPAQPIGNLDGYAFIRCPDVGLVGFNDGYAALKQRCSAEFRWGHSLNLDYGEGEYLTKVATEGDTEFSIERVKHTLKGVATFCSPLYNQLLVFNTKQCFAEKAEVQTYFYPALEAQRQWKMIQSVQDWGDA